MRSIWDSFSGEQYFIIENTVHISIQRNTSQKKSRLILLIWDVLILVFKNITQCCNVLKYLSIKLAKTPSRRGKEHIPLRITFIRFQGRLWITVWRTRLTPVAKLHDALAIQLPSNSLSNYMTSFCFFQ